MLRRGSECLVSKLQILFRTSLPKVTGKGSWPFDTFIKQKWKNTMPFGGTLLVFKPVCRNSSEIYHYLLISFGKTLVWYTHKTSGFKTSGFKTSIEIKDQYVRFLNLIYLVNKKYGNCQVCIPIYSKECVIFTYY